jgi:hypothetical protein
MEEMQTRRKKKHTHMKTRKNKRSGEKNKYPEKRRHGTEIQNK